MSDLREAMRANDSVRKDAIRMLRAAIINAEIAAQHPLDDAQIQQLIARDIKHREETIELLERANRSELIQIEKASIQVLQDYLPQQMNREQVEQVVQDVIIKLGATNISQLGAVMREAMAQLKGQADGRLVNEIVRHNLTS
ncbi:MAG: GatB/YqeY domain-containing protein [Anaerolineae bacterium]